MFHSKRYATYLQYAPASSAASVKISTKGDAIAYGRTAAVLGWARSDIENEVEASVLGVAIAAYEKRLIQLVGAPF